MTIFELLLLLLVAGVCGSLAQRLAGYSHGGCLVSIVLGFIGALLGTYLAREAGLPELLTVQIGGRSFPVIWSIIGASLFAALLALIRRPRG
ncbi:MAG: GlsB/YeaQ/YmgE family stress response membrane protein [Fuerstia sp.]|nr:GlsB/YeaQ/YmgE family stress response membrane protein [Fuerstiella sp.]